MNRSIADAKYRRIHRTKRNLRHQEYKRNNRQKMNAHGAVARAIEKGELIRPRFCEMCYRDGIIEGHHDDYSKPLNVRWLCTRCHGIVHSSK